MVAIVARAALSALTNKQLTRQMLRQSRNMARRSENIRALGMQTKDMDRLKQAQTKLDALRDASGTLQNAKRSELLKVASEFNKLDTSPGTRVQTAANAYRREQQAKRRSDLLEALNNPQAASRLTAPELKEAAQLARKKMRDQARYVEKKTGSSTHATRKLKEATAQKLSSMNRNQLLSHVSRLGDISRYEGMTVQGAREQMARGVEWFGDQWMNYSPEEQSAIWDEVHKYRAAHETRSDVAIYTIKEQLDEGRRHGYTKATFDRDPSSGNIRGVNFGYDTTAGESAREKKAAGQAIGDMMERAPEPLLPEYKIV